MTTHICIVSERLIPNLIPALMLKPERVLLITSMEMEQRGLTARLNNLLGSRGFDVTVKSGLPCGRLSLISEYAKRLAADVRQSFSKDELVLNLTGGNKLMTIAFWQVLGPAVGKTIYTDTASELLEELPQPGHAEGISSPLESVLDIPLHLAAQGMRLRVSRSDEPRWEAAVHARTSLTDYLCNQARPLGDFIGKINHLAGQALDERSEDLIQPLQHFSVTPWGPWADAVSRIDQLRLARWDGHTGIVFRDAEAARYLNGGWLEEYAWLAASELQPDDIGLRVEGDWEDTRKGSNELDVVIVHRNRLLLIECKTLRMGWDTKQSDNSMLYKLDSVGEHVRSLFGEMVLLSAREPSPMVKDRAAHHRIQVVGPDRLSYLQPDIHDWMEQGRFPRSSSSH